jgi:hypothetical protein
MDLLTGTTTTLLTTNGLAGTPTIGSKDQVHVVTEIDMLLTVSRAGLKRSVPLFSLPEGWQSEPMGALGAGIGLGSLTGSRADETPSQRGSLKHPVLVDNFGKVAFATPGGLVGVVMPDGQLHFVAESACTQPVDLVPSGRRKFVLVCSTGDVFLFGS